MAQLGGKARGRSDEGSAGVVARGVANHRVAHVEAREDAFRRVELKDAAHVHREVGFARIAEVGEEERLALEVERLVARDLRDAAEGDDAGARLGEDAEAVEAAAVLDARLHLRGIATDRGVDAEASARVEVALDLERQIVGRVKAEPRATARLGLRAFVKGAAEGEPEAV